MKKKLTHLSFFLLSIFVFFYMCYIGIQTIFRYNSFKLEYQALNDQFQKECLLNHQYTAGLASMKDGDFWEMEAKVKLGMVKEGETVFRMIPLHTR